MYAWFFSKIQVPVLYNLDVLVNDVELEGNYSSTDALCLQIIDKILSELEPVCLSEQDFCVRFFHLAGDTSVNKDAKQVKL